MAEWLLPWTVIQKLLQVNTNKNVRVRDIFIFVYFCEEDLGLVQLLVIVIVF